MDIKQIQDLIRFVSKSGVNEVSIEQNDFKITIKTNQAPTYVTATLPPAPVHAPQPASAVPAAEAPVHVNAPADVAPAADNANYITVKSPMIGTFYRAAGQD